MIELLKEAFGRYAIFLALQEESEGTEKQHIDDILSTYCRVFVILLWAIEREKMEIPEEMLSMCEVIFEEEMAMATSILEQHREIDKLADKMAKSILN